MDVGEFIFNYRNHPVLFIGTGISLRYLRNSYTWDGLLKNVSYDLTGNNEYYLDVKSRCETNGKYEYDKIASQIEYDFNQQLQRDRDGKFKKVNDTFYENMEKGVNISRFKIYLADLLSTLDFKDEVKSELLEFKKVRKNIGSIITTNYDLLIENIFEFEPLVGNDILLSNPYGSVYKIHGCVSNPAKIIITETDYNAFETKYELIRAQLLSMFIHNPIVFLGYSIGDENIKSILKTIFTYVEPNSAEAARIRNNFLLVEYDESSMSREICEHDIDLEGFSTIRINKIKTNDFSSVYQALSSLVLPVSAMDVRKVQGVVREIYSGGDIKVNITEDLDALKNGDKILAIGSVKTITYQYQTIPELMANYFTVIDEANSQLLKLINKQSIATNQYFPIFGFSTVCDEINEVDRLKKQQREKVHAALVSMSAVCKTNHSSVVDILKDQNVASCNKESAIIWSLCNGKVSVEDVKTYLISHEDKKCTAYRKLLCAYDLTMFDVEDLL